MAEHTNGTATNGTAADGTAQTHTRTGDTNATGADACSLKGAWALRNASAQALLLAESHLQRMIEDANVADLVTLVETFSPTRSTGPDWNRTFEPLVERLWTWCDDETMAALHADFAARGMPWMAVANAFAPDRAAEVRARVRRPAWSRFPVFATA
jgi:hypothetical protein